MSNADIDYIEAELRKTTHSGSRVNPWPPTPADPHWYNAITRLETLRTVAPPPPPPPPIPSIWLFEDQFVGPVGSPPDPSKWCVIGGTLNGCPRDPANVFLDGAGHLVIRSKRTSTGFSGGFLGTFNYSGWPPSVIKQSFSLPFRVEMSALMPPTPGAHASLWPMNVDRPTSQNIYEIDVAEERLTFPSIASSHQHTWLTGHDAVPPLDAQRPVADMTKNWHVYAADVYSDHVTTYVDGVKVGSFYGVSGVFGLLIDSGIDPAGSWGSGGKQPDTADPGPWDMLIDYVRVTRLP